MQRRNAADHDAMASKAAAAAMNGYGHQQQQSSPSGGMANMLGDESKWPEVIRQLMNEAAARTQQELDALRAIYNRNLKNLMDECAFLEQVRLFVLQLDKYKLNKIDISSNRWRFRRPVCVGSKRERDASWEANQSEALTRARADQNEHRERALDEQGELHSGRFAPAAVFTRGRQGATRSAAGGARPRDSTNPTNVRNRLEFVWCLVAHINYIRYIYV